MSLKEVPAAKQVVMRLIYVSCKQGGGGGKTMSNPNQFNWGKDRNIFHITTEKQTAGRTKEHKPLYHRMRHGRRVGLYLLCWQFIVYQNTSRYSRFSRRKKWKASICHNNHMRLMLIFSSFNFISTLFSDFLAPFHCCMPKFLQNQRSLRFGQVTVLVYWNTMQTILSSIHCTRKTNKHRKFQFATSLNGSRHSYSVSEAATF